MNDNLTTGAQRIVETAIEKKTAYQHAHLGINHWLVALLDRHPAMAESFVENFNAESIRRDLLEKLKNGDPGIPLAEEEVLKIALESAQKRGKIQAGERDMAVVILQQGGYTVNKDAVQPPGMAATGQAGETSAKSALTPTLDQFGLDLSASARAGKISPVVGRQEEITLMIETLCRRTKRNPVLVGPAGVGKTAIVEGMALRVANGEVPAMLKDVRLISLQPSTLVAGASTYGALDERMKNIIREASQEGIVLFIDEIHSMIGAGGMVGSSDIASILKPALARGDLACIAATTDDEYRLFIERDTALERRFQPVRVNELEPELTLEVLNSLGAVMSARYAIQIEAGVTDWLVDFAQQFMRNRHFPDKAVDLLEQCFANAVTRSLTQVTQAQAQEVAQRLVGMPLALEERLERLENNLKDQGILSATEISQFLARLQVTLRGLDLHTTRPNVVALLGGEAANNAEALAETVAGALFGDSRRVLTIDFSRFYGPEEITLLVGAPPGYVGYSDALPIHRLAQMPWCVVRFENVDQCHPMYRETLAQAFATGRLVDGRGKPVYFSDAVVMLTAAIKPELRRSLGFRTEESAVLDVKTLVEQSLGTALAEQIDLVAFGSGAAAGISSKWLSEHLLVDLTKRYLKQGVEVAWDASLFTWLSERQEKAWSERDWETWVDTHLSPSILPYLTHPGKYEEVVVTIAIENDRVITREEKKDA